MTDKKHDDQSVQTTQGHVDQTATTKPAMAAHGRPRLPSVPKAEPTLGEVMAAIGTISNNVHVLGENHTLTNESIKVLGDRIGNLDLRLAVHERAATSPPPPMPRTVARAKLDSFSEIDDSEVVSGSVLRSAMRKQKDDQNALANRQTLELEAQTLRIQTEGRSQNIKAVLATVSAIVIALSAQYVAGRNTVVAEVRESTREAVREEAAKAMPVQPAPNPNPSGAY